MLLGRLLVVVVSTLYLMVFLVFYQHVLNGLAQERTSGGQNVST